ncbi:hypothetical protein ASD15_21515 [Massilia sp. Root351]|uniref:putative quinol monooxygenase n=1 Tax=Massilia sp. Root351 TaxID=1736522 RepID=UPI000710F144|nr:hypothetical protein ASD15_21515 [Massilia sp. Root351]
MHFLSAGARRQRALGGWIRHPAEPGCLGYEVYRGVEAPGSLLLIERYRDEAALEAHKQSGHYHALVVGPVLPLLEARRVEIFRQ